MTQKQWLVAEGALLRLLAMGGDPRTVLDALGYALLMQGHYLRAQQVLERALQQGSRSFWTSHKLADALVGQQRFSDAVAAYEKALVDGSDSPLTVRNLLSTLEKIQAGSALQRIKQQPPSLPDFSLEGIAQAARMLSCPQLATWLLDQGWIDAELAHLAWRSALLQMNTAEAMRLVVICDGSAPAIAWRTRLQSLLNE